MDATQHRPNLLCLLISVAVWFTFATSAITRTLQFRLEPDGTGILTTISTATLLILIPLILVTVFLVICYYSVLRGCARVLSALTACLGILFVG